MDVIVTRLWPVTAGAGVHIKRDGPQGRGYSNNST
jgi:hypothetical protein